jgi:aspartyl-tRNA(Asn)/glutamyl-tRNA(Gln) amidotransferase subunit C
MDVKHVAKLANLTLTPDEENKFSSQFSDTFKTIEKINELDTSNIEPTYQVSNLENVFRPDQIQTDGQLSSQMILSQAPNTHKGYFVVPAVFHED